MMTSSINPILSSTPGSPAGCSPTGGIPAGEAGDTSSMGIPVTPHASDPEQIITGRESLRPAHSPCNYLPDKVQSNQYLLSVVDSGRESAVSVHLLTVTEAASYLNIKTSTLYAYVENRQIPHIRIGKLIRFKQSQLDLWLTERTVHIAEHEIATDSYRGFNKSSREIDSIVTRAIAGANKVRYTPKQGKQPVSGREK